MQRSNYFAIAKSEERVLINFRKSKTAACWRPSRKSVMRGYSAAEALSSF